MPFKGRDAVRLDKGEFPFPPSPKVIEAIAASAVECNRYPNILGGDLTDALAEYTGRDRAQIIVGNGSDDLIELILKVFLQPGDEVLLPVPTFFVYGNATQILGGRPVSTNRTPSFDLDIKAICQHVTPRTKVLFIANPNNPTANLISRETICEILERVKCIVVVDECYYEISQTTVADLLERYPHLVILRSFSKGFGLAGLRVGYGIASPTIVDRLYCAAQMFPVNRIAIEAAIAALQDLSYVRSKLGLICLEREKLASALEAMGLTVYPSATNFLFLGSKGLAIPSKAIVEKLREMNIFIADFGLKPGLDAYAMRTAVGTPEENQFLLSGLEKAIAAIG